jgi:hypothetical protein
MFRWTEKLHPFGKEGFTVTAAGEASGFAENLKARAVSGVRRANIGDNPAIERT